MSQLQEIVVPPSDHTQSSATLDPRVLSSVLISLKLNPEESPQNSQLDPHERLLEIMHSSPIRALLDAATNLASQNGVAPHEALQQIVVSLKAADSAWNEVLLKEGLARLGSQYH